MYKKFKKYQDVAGCCSCDVCGSEENKTKRPLDALSELPLALIGGRCAPPKLPAEAKAKTSLMKVGVGLAVAAVHQLWWPYQQQDRKAPSRSSNEVGQGRRPQNAPEATYAIPPRFRNQFQPKAIQSSDVSYHHPFCQIENQAGFEFFPAIEHEVRRRSEWSFQLKLIHP